MHGDYSRHPLLEPDDAVPRAAAVLPKHWTRLACLAKPTGSFIFARGADILSAVFLLPVTWFSPADEDVCPTVYPDVIRLSSQSPNRGDSCETANSNRARLGTISSARRCSHARKILSASQCGLIARTFAPPPG